MPVSTNKTGNLGGNEQVNNYQIQSQINNTPAFKNVTGSVNGIRNGDFSMTVGSDRISLWLGAANGTRHQIQLPKTLSQYQYIAYQTGTTAPTTAEFPNDGDWGWFKNETTQYIYFVINHNGAIITQSIETLIGNITSSQHGNLSASTSTMHSFPQLTGTITADQHGDLSASTVPMHSFVQVTGSLSATQHGDLSSSTATMHSFASILGSLTDDKHGALGYQTSGGSNLHSLATTAHAGFMSVTYATMLETADAVPNNSSSALTKYQDGQLRCYALYVRNAGDTVFQPVVRSRGAAISDPTGGGTVDTQARTAINAILDRLRDSTGHGLIAG